MNDKKLGNIIIKSGESAPHSTVDTKVYVRGYNDELIQLNFIKSIWISIEPSEVVTASLEVYPENIEIDALVTSIEDVKDRTYETTPTRQKVERKTQVGKQFAEFALVDND